MRTDDREGAQDELAKYVVETKGSHVSWAYSTLFAQFIYLVNVVGQIFFTDCFLGWEFTKYGVRALSFIEADVSNRQGESVRNYVFCLFLLFNLFLVSLVFWS